MIIPMAAVPRMLMQAEFRFTLLMRAIANRTAKSQGCISDSSGQAPTRLWPEKLAQEEDLVFLCGHYGG